MATREDFCSFEALEGHCAPLSALSGVTTGDVAEAISSASDLIWALTGRQFGAYTETVRPDLRNVSSSSFDLRRFPVSGIVEVKIDGVALDPSEYWVSDGHTLNRTDGTSWPVTQKLYLEDTEEETFSVTLTWGAEPPIGVQQATRRLACELLSLKFGGQSGLPDRVRSTVRQGISMEHVSAEDLLNNGRTGIFEIDLVLSTYNRDETAALPAVMSPDIGWYDHDGTTTVGAQSGIDANYVLSAISQAISGLSGGTSTGDVRLFYMLADIAGYEMFTGETYDPDVLPLAEPFPAGVSFLILDGDGLYRSFTTQATAATTALADDPQFMVSAAQDDGKYPALYVFADLLATDNTDLSWSSYIAVAATATTEHDLVPVAGRCVPVSGGGTSLSDTTPQALGTAAAGTGTAAARDDHVHAMPTAADVGADADGAAQAVADTLGTAATLDVGTTAGTVAAGDDSRLSDARTPVSHNHAASEVTSGTLDIARLPTGTTSTTVPLGNDGRFTDSRTPTAHKTSHATGGSDELALDASQITTGTVPTARLGSGSASSTTYLLGDQTWAKSARPILTASRRTAAGFGTPLTPLSNYASTAAVGKGVLYGLLCHNRPETISELMIAVTATSLTGSQVVIVGAADLNAGLPGSLLWSESITVGTTTGVISKTGLSRALPEWCWLIVLNPNSNAGTVTLRGGPPSLNAMQILAPFSASVGNIVALASPYTSADTLPSSYSSYDITAGSSSSAGRWGFTDAFPLISAVV